MWRACGVLVLVWGLAGGCSGGDDGRADPKAGEQVVVAEFDPEFLPRGVAVDGEGTVYTSGWDGERFVIAAFPEDGKPTRRPIPCATDKGAEDAIGGSLAAAPDGTLYWSMDVQYRVVRLDPDGGGECFAGTGTEGSSGDGGPALEAQFGQVKALAYDPGGDDLYLSESRQDVVRKVDGKGVITTVIGPEGIGGQGSAARVAFDQRRGRLYTHESAGIAYRARDGTGVVIRGDIDDEAIHGLAADPTGGDLVVTRPGYATRSICDVIRVSDTGAVRPVPNSSVLPECAYQVAVDVRGDIWVVTGYQLIVIRPPG